MKTRSLLLLALIGGLFFARIPEAHAITSCAVCSDGVHPCAFKCYTGTYQFPFVTTCKGAGYQCTRGPLIAVTPPELGEHCDATRAFETPLVDLVSEWAREGLAFVDRLYRVAVLDSRVTIARG
jgi:hypothetical protein